MKTIEQHVADVVGLQSSDVRDCRSSLKTLVPDFDQRVRVLLELDYLSDGQLLSSENEDPFTRRERIENWPVMGIAMTLESKMKHVLQEAA